MSAFSLQRILPVLLASALGCCSVCAEEEADKLSAAEIEKLDSLRLRYDLAREEIKRKEGVELKELKGKYSDALAKLERKFQEDGDLNKVRGVRAAASADSDKPFPTGFIKEARASQDKYFQLRDNIIKKHVKEIVELNHAHVKDFKSCISELTKLQENLTKAGEIDKAISVDDELERIKMELVKLTDELKFDYSFFGVRSYANRVVFVVDFSGSMLREGGGLRLKRLKEELVKTLSKLPKGMKFQVIYFSHAQWLGGETLLSAPVRFAQNPTDRIPWIQATKESKTKAINDVRAAQPQGGTRWKPPLELALAMKPAPSLIWLLSDGAADDREEVLDSIEKINPLNIPINTIGLELPGLGFTSLVGISRRTGGQASIVINGRPSTGAAALRYATDEFGGGAP